MATRTITVPSHCLTPGCGQPLVLIDEGVSGTCCPGRLGTLQGETRRAMARGRECQFDGTSQAEREAIPVEALRAITGDPLYPSPPLPAEAAPPAHDPRNPTGPTAGDVDTAAGPV